MTDGTFLSRAWPSIVALVGTVAVVFGLLFMFGDDGSDADEAAAGDDTAGEQNTDGDPATTPDPAAEQTGDATGTQDGETSGQSNGNGDGNSTEDPDGPPATPVEAPDELRTPVGVLNSTTVAGLAAGAQDRFIEGGWEVPVITDYSGEVEGTTVYYPPDRDDLQASAEALQAQFPEIMFVEPTPPGPLTRERILVILAEDYAEAVGTTEESG